MGKVDRLKDLLLNKGANHFAIFSSVGDVLECSGDFKDEEKQHLAYSVMQQATTLLRPGETLGRISMALDGVVYLASVVLEQGEHFGVLVKRTPADAISIS
ncbi:hypothetical protein ERJ75_000714500 [Trypanosoma vivax]|uniref:Roadblock/LAMTOR2 domain-containing protein n=1 Tax=Trypanosoma vivax (strain Y486) TaxID=1055687 RepID=G0TTS7_TRYVY|nr:hypothetical protein TRVL_00072 [Trypanosoma vivax]KAH8613671.1 hypothetical protein ERJ75_000714500 [Trypanosoma vivax]CCC47358.1 conserved hypothetical protein, unlikely [Trypanosoma vivax Y486]